MSAKAVYGCPPGSRSVLDDAIKSKCWGPPLCVIIYLATTRFDLPMSSGQGQGLVSILTLSAGPGKLPIRHGLESLNVMINVCDSNDIRHGVEEHVHTPKNK
ncbi:hypothetical protein GGX14DRAFT_399294 [Mycena pura]|uniref:Uncharacterized protein n=1 Tax=Mycena pura TaxID=153505 RepID=A0AAD6Y6U8_9AGAR|nr:hypothetical protein GGX14DRAFT_399294 [Mycena pura]